MIRISSTKIEMSKACMVGRMELLLLLFITVVFQGNTRRESETTMKYISCQDQFFISITNLT